MDEAHSQFLTVIDNIGVYRELATVNVGQAGRAAVQKRIRKLLRQMIAQTSGNWAAWQEGFKRWLPLMQASTIVEPTGEAGDKRSKALKNPQQTVRAGRPDLLTLVDDKGEWQNYTGFLAALGGICMCNNPSAEKPAQPDTSGLRMVCVSHLCFFFQPFIFFSSLPFALIGGPWVDAPGELVGDACQSGESGAAIRR